MTDPAILLARTPEEVQAGSDSVLERARGLVEAVSAVGERRTVANTLAPFDELYVGIQQLRYQSWFLSAVHPDSEMRKAGEAASRRAQAFLDEVHLNRDLYEAFEALDVREADVETRSAVGRVLRDYRRSGVDREEAVRRRIRKVRDEITAAKQEFGRNIQEGIRSIQVDRPEDLEGLPKDFLDAHPPNSDGRVVITTQWPDAFPVFRFARNSEIRRRLLYEFNNTGHPANLETLHRLLTKRHELAQQLGYDHYAAFDLETTMLGTPERVEEFLERVVRVAQAPADQEYAELLEEKRRENPRADALDPWDVIVRGDTLSPYLEHVRTRRFGFDTKLLRPYLALNAVRDGLFSITSLLFGIRYHRVPGAPVWHPLVDVYDVFDGPARIGRVYLDLHVREGKRQGAFAYGVVRGVRGLRLQQAALVCNFQGPPSSNGPVLLDHDEAVVLFHEFGHVLHGLLSAGRRWGMNAPGEMEFDFIEVPSQFLEEWVRAPKSLQTFARHHETGEPLPAELVDQMDKAHAAGRGLLMLQWAWVGLMALRCHTENPGGLDTTELARELQDRYDLVPWFEGTHFQCGVPHLASYAARFYTYQWSQAIVRALLVPFVAKGTLLDSELGMNFRQSILEPGASQPAAELVRSFLGHEPELKRFEEWLNAFR